MDVAIVYNEPTLPPGHRDFEQEAGVLESVAAFEEALSGGGHEVWRLAVGDSVPALVERLCARRPQVIVNFCEAFAGKTAGEAHLAALFELLAIPYTGSPPECLALVRDKARTKWLVGGAALGRVPFVFVNADDLLPKEPLTWWLGNGPLFVKPAAEDASLGISQDSVVSDWNALERQVERVASQFGSVLIEPFVDGREFNVGVISLVGDPPLGGTRLGREAAPEPQTKPHRGFPLWNAWPYIASRGEMATCLPLAEIEFRVGVDMKWPIVTYDGKWAAGSAADRATPVRCPAEVDEALAVQIRQVALAAFRVTGCRDYARVDLRVGQQGKPYVLEVNANPDAGPNAGLATALKAAGIEYAEFALQLVETAASRGNRAPAR
jgi:D-alanine-D-alanine ligase